MVISRSDDNASKPQNNQNNQNSTATIRIKAGEVTPDLERHSFQQTPNKQSTRNPFNTMCYHKRIVYLCAHSGWGKEVRACNLQKAFLDGSRNEECETMFSHPLQSIRVQSLCNVCAAKKGKTDRTMSSLRARLMALSETVTRLQKSADAEELNRKGDLDEDTEEEAEDFPATLLRRESSRRKVVQRWLLK
jgi:hypothetical protein